MKNRQMNQNIIIRLRAPGEEWTENKVDYISPAESTESGAASDAAEGIKT
jgi:hypothetical protein